MLDNILRGVARLPALLTDPSRSLLCLDLDKYEVVANEPLHDLKGHIINLITELPHVLPNGDIITQCTHLISCCLAKEKRCRSPESCNPALPPPERSRCWFQNSPPPADNHQNW